jgi:beta-lactam-binding protein with PASTA domain
MTQTQARKIRAKLYQLPSIYPMDHAFAQYPAANQIVNDAMIVYMSCGSRKPVIFPNLKDLTVQEAKEHLATQPITIQTTHIRSAHGEPSRTTHDCSSCIILDQRPLPGSIIALDESKPLPLNLQVTHRW